MSSNDTIRNMLGGFQDAIDMFNETLGLLEVKQKTDPSDELKEEIRSLRKMIRDCVAAQPVLIEVAQKECTHEHRFQGYRGDEDVYKCEHCGHIENLPFIIRRTRRG